MLDEFVDDIELILKEHPTATSQELKDKLNECWMAILMSAVYEYRIRINAKTTQFTSDRRVANLLWDCLSIYSTFQKYKI